MTWERALKIVASAAAGAALSFLNLGTAWFTLQLLGGLGEWSDVQFVGIFGLIEASIGLAFVVGPNLWALPVLESERSGPAPLRLAFRSVFTPHWMGLVKTATGTAFVSYAALQYGASWATATVPAAALLLALAAVGLSLIVARAGVAIVHHDVFQLVVRRPGRDDRVLPALSLTGLAVPVVLNFATFPPVQVIPLDTLYRPELAVSPAVLEWLAVIAVTLAIGGVAAWWGRFALRRDQPAPVPRGLLDA